MNSARIIRLGAIAQAHSLLSNLYSEMLLCDSDRRRFEIELEIRNTRELINCLHYKRGGERQHD